MAKTLDEQLLSDVLQAYASAESQMLNTVAKRAKKGASNGWPENTLASISEMKAEIEKQLSSSNNKGKIVMGEGMIDAYVSGLAGPLSGKKSSIDTSSITNDVLKGNIHKAFDFAKSMPGGYTDPDTVFKSVKYATGAMAVQMEKQSSGAIVVGDTVYVCKKYEHLVDDSFIVHEIGHKVTKAGSKITEAGAKHAADDLAKQLKLDPGKMAAYISEYAKQGPTEMYPEALMTYYDAVKKGKAIQGEKKKIVEAIMDQMYAKDPLKTQKALDFLSNIDIPNNLKMGIMAVNGLLDNASTQILRNADDVFSDIQGKSAMGVLTGVDTRIQATQKALNEYASKGITSFKDKSGRSWNLGSYAEMCARTVTAHAALEGHIQMQTELGEDLMKVSSIGTTCPICAQWQGVVLSVTGKSDGYHTIEQARLAGVFHPNCKHTLTLHISELDGPGRKETIPLDETSTSYLRNKLIEKQRGNERKIRYWKNRAILAVTPDEALAAKQKVRFWQNKNLHHCESNNLKRAYAREGLMTGNAKGPMGPFVGGSISDAKQFYRDIIGADPDEIFDELTHNYGAKPAILHLKGAKNKWLKDEITSLDSLSVELSQMKDASNKAFTPTTMYKKYIGDSPTQDYKLLHDAGMTGMTYANWLATQVADIGHGYKLKPEFVEAQEALPGDDASLSATELYKKYNNGEAPTKAYKALGGELGTKMTYGKWIEAYKKKLVNEGVAKKYMKGTHVYNSLLGLQTSSISVSNAASQVPKPAPAAKPKQKPTPKQAPTPASQPSTSSASKPAAQPYVPKIKDYILSGDDLTKNGVPVDIEMKKVMNEGLYSYHLKTIATLEEALEEVAYAGQLKAEASLKSGTTTELMTHNQVLFDMAKDMLAAKTDFAMNYQSEYNDEQAIVDTIQKIISIIGNPKFSKAIGTTSAGDEIHATYDALLKKKLEVSAATYSKSKAASAAQAAQTPPQPKPAQPSASSKKVQPQKGDPNYVAKVTNFTTPTAKELDLLAKKPYVMTELEITKAHGDAYMAELQKTVTNVHDSHKELVFAVKEFLDADGKGSTFYTNGDIQHKLLMKAKHHDYMLLKQSLANDPAFQDTTYLKELYDSYVAITKSKSFANMPVDEFQMPIDAKISMVKLKLENLGVSISGGYLAPANGFKFSVNKSPHSTVQGQAIPLNQGLTQIDDSFKQFSQSEFTQARKDAALWFKDAAESYKKFAQDTSSIWQTASQDERRAVFDYTAGSGHMNRPLRGYNTTSWKKHAYVGPGSVSWNNESSKGAKNIKHATDLIQRSELKQDTWLQRGVSPDGFAAALGIDGYITQLPESEFQALVGKVYVDEGFTSCGSSKGTGFSGVTLNIYCPKGTKGIYAEPFSAFGRGGLGWDGTVQKGYVPHSENETILQRGTAFRITKAYRVGQFGWYLDVEVIAQREYTDD